LPSASGGARIDGVGAPGTVAAILATGEYQTIAENLEELVSRFSRLRRRRVRARLDDCIGATRKHLDVVLKVARRDNEPLSFDEAE
jgi:hypothetical protein